jgi:hypothetical protein
LNSQLFKLILRISGELLKLQTFIIDYVYSRIMKKVFNISNALREKHGVREAAYAPGRMRIPNLREYGSIENRMKNL